jgi:HSP20 family protein
MPKSQQLLVNIFENPDEVVVVSAVPGIEPEDITIELRGHKLQVKTRARGEEAESKYLAREWSYGPYERTVELTMPVDGKRANAMYGNGVLTIVLPKSPVFVDNIIGIPKIGHARGAYQGMGAIR